MRGGEPGERGGADRGDRVARAPGDARERDGLARPREHEGHAVEAERRQVGDGGERDRVECDLPRPALGAGQRRGAEARGGDGDQRAGRRERAAARVHERVGPRRPGQGLEDGEAEVATQGGAQHPLVERPRAHAPPPREHGEGDRAARVGDDPRRAVQREGERDVREHDAQRAHQQADLVRHAARAQRGRPEREVHDGERGDPGGRAPAAQDRVAGDRDGQPVEREQQARRGAQPRRADAQLVPERGDDVERAEGG